MKMQKSQLGDCRSQWFIRSSQLSFPKLDNKSKDDLWQLLNASVKHGAICSRTK